MKKRLQINIAVDQAFLDAVDEIRALTRPVPSITEVIRVAVAERRERVKRQAERAR